VKKRVLPILIAALIIAQAVSLMKINDLQSQINNARFTIDNMSNNIRNEINDIYANVDEMLKREVSLIEIASTELGELDVDSLTATVTFSLTPKEVSEYTAIYLDIGGELIPMDRIGTNFTATVSHDIFGSVSPMIVIDESGIRKTTQDDRIVIWSMKDMLLPTMYPRLEGKASYSGDSYEHHGRLRADVKNVKSEIVFTEIRFVIKVDAEVISSDVIPLDVLSDGWQVDRIISLNNGQTCIMTVIATDSVGLEHHYMVAHWVSGASAQREPWFGFEQIYSADGKLLWAPEYELFG